MKRVYIEGKAFDWDERMNIYYLVKGVKMPDVDNVSTDDEKVAEKPKKRHKRKREEQ